LNHFIRKSDYPYVSVRGTLDAIGGNAYYTGIDLTKAFYAIEIEPSDQWKTAFRTHNSLMCMKRLPMGMSTSPKAMQRLADLVVGERPFLTAYVDDLLCHSLTFEDHLRHFSELLERLRDYGLKVTPKKCQLFRKELEFLGFIVSEDGLRIPESRIRAIRDIPIPTRVRLVRAFLGVVNYCREFIDNIGQYSRPLQDLIKDDVPFEWTEERNTCFERLKAALTSAPVLVFPDERYPKVLQTDASQRGVGGLIGQVMDGKVRVIAFYNKTLSKAEQNYSTVEKELYAILVATRLYRPFLMDSHFEIYTDHKPLLVLNQFQKKINNGRLNRWGIELSQYDFTVKYIPGLDNEIADGLSRLLRSRKEEQISGENVMKRHSHELVKAIDNEDIDCIDNNACSYDESAVAQALDIYDVMDNRIFAENEDINNETIVDNQKNDINCQMILKLLKSKDIISGKMKNRFTEFNGILYHKKRKSAY
jgi:hypothetical protein